MAKFTLNSALTSGSGKLDGFVYKKFKDGEVILAKKTRTANRTWSPLQDDGRDRHREATAYAKAIWADPEKKSFYVRLAKKKKAWRAFSLAVGDFRNPPTIKKVDLKRYRGRAGGVIAVDAEDDIGVVALEIHVRDRAGKVWEEGVATPEIRFDWEYAATTTIPPGTELEIEIVAVDRPGNRTMQWRTFTVPDKGS